MPATQSNRASSTLPLSSSIDSARRRKDARATDQTDPVALIRNLLEDLSIHLRFVKDAHRPSAPSRSIPLHDAVCE